MNLNLTPSLIVEVILGLLLLFAGRRLYWVFVALVGFVAGMSLAARYLDPNTSELLILAIGLGAGLIGAVLAYFVQKLAIGIAGFFGGGQIAMAIMANIGAGTLAPHMEWIPFIIGGIIGVILVSMLFDWALIIISSLMGAQLLVQNFHLAPANIWLLGIAVVGIAVQAGLFYRGRTERAAVSPG